MPNDASGREAVASRITHQKALLVFAASVALFTFVVYLPSLTSGFVNWDDPAYVYENTDIRSFDFNFLRLIFTTAINGNYHPLTTISYAMDYGVWGLRPFGFHLTNNLFHAVDVFLVFILFDNLLGLLLKENSLSKTGGAETERLLGASFAALLFGLHPLHVESVAWVSERKDVLSAFFFLLTLLSYLKYTGERSLKKPRYYLLTLVLFGLGLLSKPMLVTLPVVLLILDYYPLHRLGGDLPARLREKAPFFMLSFASGVVTIWAQSTQGAVMSGAMLPLLWRMDIAVRAAVFYLQKTVIPVNLAPFYPFPYKEEFFNHVFWTSATVLAAFVVLAVVMAIKKRRLIPGASLYYIITLSPVIGLVQVGAQSGADRYAYITLLGPFFLAGAVIFSVGRRFGIRPAIAVIVLISVCLSVLTVRQEFVWKDSVSLWSREIAIYPDRAPRAYQMRGLAFQDRGDFKAAIEDFTAAVMLQPEYAEAYNNRGVAYRMSGSYGLAVADFQKAISINANLAAAYYNLGAAYSDAGETYPAIEAFRKAEELGYRP